MDQELIPLLEARPLRAVQSVVTPRHSKGNKKICIQPYQRRYCSICASPLQKPSHPHHSGGGPTGRSGSDKGPRRVPTRSNRTGDLPIPPIRGKFLGRVMRPVCEAQLMGDFSVSKCLDWWTFPIQKGIAKQLVARLVISGSD